MKFLLSKLKDMAREYYNNDPVIKAAIDRMSTGINNCQFREVADSFNKDPYMVLADFILP